MAKKYVTVKFVFKEVTDPADEEYTSLELTKIKRGKTDMTDDELDDVTERWGQSDKYWVNYTSDILSALDGSETEYHV